MAEDKNGRLWIATSDHVLRVPRDKLLSGVVKAADVREYDQADGLESTEGVKRSRSVVSDSAGRIWFSLSSGLSVVNPSQINDNSVPALPHIEAITADNNTANLAAFVQIPPSPRRITFEYTGLSLAVPGRIRFRYFLEGFDSSWSQPVAAREAVYTNLGPGSYRFRLVASNSEGLWNGPETAIALNVAPAYYQTYWFRLSCFAAFIALLWALYRWRVHRLKSQEKRLRDVVETIPAMTFTALSNGSYTFVNKRWTEYTGLSVEQSSGVGWQRAIHPEDLVRHSEKWRISVATGQVFEDEARFRRAADGEYRWFLVRGVPLRDRHGDIVKWYGTLTDIEDRKRAEEALQQSQLYLVEGQRLAHMGSWAFNSAGFDYWSSELFHVYGLDPGGKPPTIKEYLDLVHPEDRNFMEQEFQKMLADHREFDFTKRIVRPDGNIRYVRCVGVPVTEGGTFQGFVGTGIDVTEQELLEQERERIRQLETELAHTNRVSMLGEMAASLAHEIKQPIAAAITSANSCIEWLAHEPPNLDRARAAAAKIDKYGNRAAEIIDRIRSFYKKSPPQRELVDVNGIIQEMLTLLKGEADSILGGHAHGTCRRTAQNHGGPCATAAGVHEPHAQRHRSHEGLRRRAYGEVGTAGRSTPVLGQ